MTCNQRTITTLYCATAKIVFEISSRVIQIIMANFYYFYQDSGHNFEAISLRIAPLQIRNYDNLIDETE